MTTIGKNGVRKHERTTRNCKCGGPCFYCGDDLPGAHEHDHMPFPWTAGGRATVPSCRRCHTLKDRKPLQRWSPAALESVEAGVGPKAQLVVGLVASCMQHGELCDMDEASALEAIDDTTTCEARIAVAAVIAKGAALGCINPEIAEVAA